MAVSKSFIKYAVERRRLYLDYSNRLEDSENLTSFQVVISPDTPDAPLVVNTAFADIANKKLQCYVSGGRRGLQYVVQFIVQTDEGQKWRDDVAFGIS